MLAAICTTLTAAGISGSVQRLAADSGYWSIANVSAITDAPELLIPPARHGRHGKPRKDGKPTPRRERQVVIHRAGQRDLLDRLSLTQRERSRPPSRVPRVERLEPVIVEIVDHIPDPVRARDRHPGDLGDVHPLRGEQHHLRSPPRHHRPRATPHDRNSRPPSSFAKSRTRSPSCTTPPDLDQDQLRDHYLELVDLQGQGLLQRHVPRAATFALSRPSPNR
jgi:hypothetical protein